MADIFLFYFGICLSSLLKRAAFVARTDAQEACRELGAIGSMMQKNPLSPIVWYLRYAVLPGAGLGLEGCVNFQRPDDTNADLSLLCPVFHRQPAAAFQSCMANLLEPIEP